MRILFSILLLSFGTAFAQTNCAKYSKNYIPIDLDDALIYLNCKWSEKDKEEFKNKTEREALANLHFGTGLSIRNGWKLWKGKNSLSLYFNTLGVFHPDDISSIIIKSFHRHLNNKEINLDQQVNFYKDYWNKIKQKELEHNKMYKTINIKDTVNVFFSKQKVTADNYSLAFLYYQKSLSDSTYCLVKGIVLDKYKKKESRLLTIQILTNNCDNSYLGETKMLKGEKFMYNMTVFNLSRN
jgi:hypothetical protein